MARSSTEATGRAPGRLDFLGGVADYSGAMVLETPIHGVTEVTVRPAAEARLVLSSRPCGRAAIDWRRLRAALDRGDDDQQLRAALDEARAPGWTRYVVGSLLVFCRAKQWLPERGFHVTVRSTVPQSMGVSSSAALEIATLRALARLARVRFQGTELAHLGQRAENRLVGAPCGLMDQLTSAFGKPGCLLPILCRPDRLGEPVRLPRGVIVVGWPSGCKHDVGASPYATARAATFMGKKIVEHRLKRRLAYASALPLSQFRATELPAMMLGREFLRRYGGTDDALAPVEPGVRYPVRDGLRFPIEEHARSRKAIVLLRRGGEESLRRVGELLLQSHAGYTSIGLGAPETDAMVDAVMALGPAQGFYGARTSGGGSGGTVVVLLRREALPKLQALARRWSAAAPKPPSLIY